MTALESDYYDTNVEEMDPDAVLYHPLYPMWQRIVDEVRNDDVFDLGCGPGPLALGLLAEGYTGTYTGVDFSSECVRLMGQAIRSAYPDSEREGKMVGHVWDLREEPPWKGIPIAGNSWFVFTEVLEHLDDDIGAIRRWVSPGHRVLMSLPNYPSESHVRHFPSPGDVFARYANVFRFRSWRLFDLSPPEGRAVHLFECVRREDELC